MRESEIEAARSGTGLDGPRLRALGVIGRPWTGVGYVRFAQPFRHLAATGFELATLDRALQLERGPKGWQPCASLLDDVSLLIFPQMVASPIVEGGDRVELARSLCLEARRREIPIVYSVDDSLGHLDGRNPAWEQKCQARGNLEAIREHADAILVTTEPLRDSLADWGRPIHVLPNAVDPADWRARPRRPGTPRVGWTGSSSHVEDLLMLLPAVRELQRRVDCEFVLQGLVDMPLAEQLRRIAEARNGFTPAQRERAERFEALAALLQEVRFSHVPFGPTAEFFELLPSLDLDVGLCPLLDTPFNRHKSANKFYEYAITGSMTIASRVTPYASEVSITVANETADWADAMELFLRDERARESELQRQREYVLAERSIETLKTSWAEALRTIVAAPVADGGPWTT